MNEVVVFAPAPVLTVTMEDHHGGADIHLHAGGQGVWQARMLLALGSQVTMCSAFSGESGRVLHHLIRDEGIRGLAVHREGRGGAYVHDRRGGERIRIAETGGEPLSRHDLDELYGLTLRAGLSAGTTILSGPASEDAVPADVYRRLSSDLRTAGRRVIADLSGERLTAVLRGGVTVVKVSDEELLRDGRITDTGQAQLTAAMHRLQAEGALNVLISRAHEPVLLLAGENVSEIHMPSPRWGVASRLAAQLIPFLLEQPAGAVLNLNVPDTETGETPEFRVATLARFGSVQTTMTEQDRHHIRLAVADPAARSEPGSDADLLAAGFATVTAIHSVGEAALSPDFSAVVAATIV